MCLAVAEYQILGGVHFLVLGSESGKKDLVVDQGTRPSERVPLPLDPPAWQEPHVDFS